MAVPAAHPTDLLSYNGVVLWHVKTLSYTKTPVYDSRGAYTYTTHRLHVASVYNPAATAYKLAGNPAAGNVQPASNPGTMAPATEAAIRFALEQPRKQLIYDVGGVHVLYCPKDGSVTDANNGPQPIKAEVTSVIGVRTFQVQFTVECYLNESHLYVTTPSVLLSHNWEQSETIDRFRNYMATRVTRGRAIFDADRLHRLGAVPDDFRAAVLAHPCPPGFRRDDIDCVATEDGVELRYQITDREYASKIRAAGVADLQVHVVNGTRKPSIGDTAYDGLNTSTAMGASTLNGVLGVLGFSGGEPTSTPAGETARFAGMVGGVGGSIRDVFTHPMEFVRRNVPVTYRNVVIRVWGNQGVSHDTLSNVAHRVLASQVGSPDGVAARFTQDISEMRDMMNPYVEVRGSFIGGLVQAAFEIAANGGNTGSGIGGFLAGALSSFGLGAVASTLPAVARSTGTGSIAAPFSSLPSDVAGPAVVSGTGNVGQVPPNVTRGASLVRIAAQALQDATEVPPTPAITLRGADLTPP